MANKPSTSDDSANDAVLNTGGATAENDTLGQPAFPDMGDDTSDDPPSDADQRFDKVTESITALQTLVAAGTQREERLLDAIERMTFRQQTDVAPAVPAPVTPPTPAPLPDPVSDPEGFSTALSERITNAVSSLADAATPQAAPDTGDSDLTGMLLAKFKARHPDLDEMSDLVLIAGQAKVQEMTAMRIDAEAYLRAQPDKFVDEVAGTVKARIAKITGAAPGPAKELEQALPATRTGGILGGNPPSSPNSANEKGEKPESMTSQIIKDQELGGFF